MEGLLENKSTVISGAGGVAETAEVDALDEPAVDKHSDAMAQKTGRIDVY